MPEYFFILMFITIITRVMHFATEVKLYQSLRQFFVVNVTMLTVGFVWDQIALARGHWVLNDKFLLGPKVGYMPIEEVLLIIVLTYAGVVVYKVSEKLS